MFACALALQLAGLTDSHEGKKRRDDRAEASKHRPYDLGNVEPPISIH